MFSKQFSFAFFIVTAAMQIGTTTNAQQIVAHRGASHDAPENTLAAFKLAWQQGADGIEGDFYLTADKEIVCIHDKDTKRTGDRELDVESSTLAELRKLDVGRWKNPKWAGEKIPTLKEVFGTVPDDRLFVIELKSKAKIVPYLAKQLRQLDQGNFRILIITFDAETAKACKESMPNQRVHWLTKFKRNVIGYKPTAKQVGQTVRDTGVEGVGMKGMREVIDRDFINQLTASGCDEFHVWTIDAIEDARYFADLGAFGITTNRPKEIGGAIHEAVGQ